MKRLFCIAGLVAISLAVPKAALASDSACYMKTSSGRVIDLGASMCSDGQPVPQTEQVRTGSASAFLADYYQSLKSIKNPASRRILESATNNNPSALVSYAQTVCRMFSQGKSVNEIRRFMIRDSSSDPDLYDATLEDNARIMVLGTAHFCPQYRGSL